MPAAETISVAWLLNKAWILLVGIMWYGKRSMDRDAKARDKAIAELEKHSASSELRFITETRMKEAIREELEPYKESQQEIKILLRALTRQMVALSKDMAVQNALKGDRRGDRSTQTPS